MARGLLVGHEAVASRDRRNARLRRELARARLVADGLDRLGARADEHELARAADLGEARALGEEPVARVDRVDVRDLGGRDDPRDVEVGLEARARPDADRLVGVAEVQRVLVDLGVDGDGLDPELLAGPDDAQGDLAPVRDEDALEHRPCSGRGIKA